MSPTPPFLLLGLLRAGLACNNLLGRRSLGRLLGLPVLFRLGCLFHQFLVSLLVALVRLGQAFQFLDVSLIDDTALVDQFDDVGSILGQGVEPFLAATLRGDQVRRKHQFEMMTHGGLLKIHDAGKVGDTYRFGVE